MSDARPFATIEIEGYRLYGSRIRSLYKEVRRYSHLSPKALRYMVRSNLPGELYEHASEFSAALYEQWADAGVITGIESNTSNGILYVIDQDIALPWERHRRRAQA